jgi:hypothetical protein
VNADIVATFNLWATEMQRAADAKQNTDREHVAYLRGLAQGYRDCAAYLDTELNQHRVDVESAEARVQRLRDERRATLQQRASS